MDGENVDQTDLVKKRDLYLQTFPNYEIIGWFHILPNRPMHPVDLSFSVHTQILQVCDNPLLMVMNPEENTDSTSELPIRVYVPVSKDMKTEFVEIGHKVETGEAERVAVDDIVKGADSSSYELSSHLNIQGNALRMFYERLQVVQNYMSKVRDGTCPRDFDLLRRINSFTAQLNKQRRTDVFNSLNVQELDAMVASLMAIVMKSEQDKIELNSKWVTMNSHGHGKSEKA